MRRFTVAAGFLVVTALVINSLLSAYVWIPSPSMGRAVRPLPETVAVVTLLLLLRERRWARYVLGSVIGILAGFSVTEGIFRFIYARSFIPRIDIPMMKGLIFLLLGDVGDIAAVLAVPAVLVILLLFLVIGIALVGGVAATMGRLQWNRRNTVPVLLVMMVPALLLPGPESLTALAIRSSLDDGKVDFVAMPEIPDEPDDEPREDYRLPGIRDRDIFLFNIEAYGYATISRPELAELIDPGRERFADALRERGYRFRSSYLLSPVAGGFSWLAESTLLTGQWIDSQNAFEQLYDADLPTLPGMLHDRGYYTLALKPGTVHGSWPEGWDIFRFEESMVAHDGDFEYVGPWFSYVAVTDQFALWKGHQRIQELRSPGNAEDRPLLGYYQFVSSHTPFNKIPPLISDWSELGDGSVYNRREDEIRYFDNNWGGGTQMDEGYSTAISYVFESLADYVEDHMDLSGDPIIIVFGDHQAQRPIREEDAHLSVPIHVASRDADILARFEREGFAPGLKSPEEPPHRRMSEFFAIFGRIALE
jgi:hypothetical protein